MKGQKSSGHRQPDNRTPKLCAEGLPNNTGTMCPDPHEQTRAQIRGEFPETLEPNHWPPTVTCQKPPKIPEAPLHGQQPLRLCGQNSNLAWQPGDQHQEADLGCGRRSPQTEIRLVGLIATLFSRLACKRLWPFPEMNFTFLGCVFGSI